jgi:methylmalonyl-CoA mutase cobalamin-binding subunit
VAFDEAVEATRAPSHSRLEPLGPLLVVVVPGEDHHAAAADVVGDELGVRGVRVVRLPLASGHVQPRPLEAAARLLARGPLVATAAARGGERSGQRE